MSFFKFSYYKESDICEMSDDELFEITDIVKDEINITSLIYYSHVGNYSNFTVLAKNITRLATNVMKIKFDIFQLYTSLN